MERVIPALELVDLQVKKVWQMEEEMEINPLSHTKDDFDKQEASYKELKNEVVNEKWKEE